MAETTTTQTTTLTLTLSELREVRAALVAREESAEWSSSTRFFATERVSDAIAAAEAAEFEASLAPWERELLASVAEATAADEACSCAARYLGNAWHTEGCKGLA